MKHHSWLLVLVMAGLGPCATRAGHPLDELRGVLKSAAIDPAERQRATQALLEQLADADLRAALQLEEWQDLGADFEVADVDRRNRALVGARFVQSIEDKLRDPNPATRLAAVNLILEMGASVRDSTGPSGLARRFTSELVEQTSSEVLPLRLAALEALGKINPEPGLAVATLRQQQGAPEVRVRRVVARSLYELMKISSELSSQRRSSIGIECAPAELVELGVVVVPVAAQGLSDHDEVVRKYSLAAVAQSATALRGLAGNNGLGDKVHGLLPLFDALCAEGDVLNRTLADKSRPVSVLARWTLEELAAAQAFLVKAGAVGADSLPAWRDFEHSLQTLTAQLGDKDVRVRRSTIDVLEAMGSAAAPVAPALVKALDDEDQFVRWAAARTLGKLGAEVAPVAVPGLVGMLAARDTDVRLAVLAALEQYGPKSRSAVPALIGLASAPEVELRIAAFKTLERIGPDGRAAVPILCAALNDADAGVRTQAARALGAMGPVAGGSLKPLYQALNDQDPDVRSAASQALLKINP